MFEKKVEYILFRKDLVESGKGKILKSGQIKLTHDIKIPKYYYLNKKRKKVFVFFDEIPHSVKFDLPKSFDELDAVLVEKLKQEVLDIAKDGDWIMTHTFTKGILDMDSEQRKIVMLTLLAGILGGMGVGIIIGVFVFIAIV